MVKIDYKFADGHVETIEVTEEVAEFIVASNREEHALEERESECDCSFQLFH